MGFYFFKILLELSRPWSLILISYALSVWALHKGKNRLAKMILVAVFIFSLVLSFPFSASTLISFLESQHPAQRVSQVTPAQAIVVLGGTVSNSLPPRIEPEETRESRLSIAAKLFLNKKSPIIFVSGGVPYSGPRGELRTESTDMKEYLLGFGIPSEVIIEEKQSRNTKENVEYLTNLLEAQGIQQFILLTSAYHMPRALSLFKKQKFDIIPFPVSFRHDADIKWQNLIPNLVTLDNSTLALKEILGMATYRLFP